MEDDSDRPTDLTCSVCSATYPAGPAEPWRCDCGAPLELADRGPPPESRPGQADLDRDRGLWAFEALLPVEDRASLGEGFTPMIDAPKWGVDFKLEYVSPTGSFKDRGATTIVSRALEVGAKSIVDDSSGNAGAAIATYAARAGLPATIYVPEGVKESKRALIERTGATVRTVAGGRAAVTEACIEAVEDGTSWYASHAWNPAFFAGTETFAYEVAVQRGWGAPDTIVSPVGHGTLLLGAARGFRRLADLGWIDRMPRIVGVQAGGYAPLAEAFGNTAPDNELADGVQIREPARREQLLEAIDDTGGTVVALGEERVESTLRQLHSAGLYVEPTSALAPAAIEDLRADGMLEEADDVVVPLTGSGLKIRW